MYYVYIIQNVNTTRDFYKGLTDDFDRRFTQHQKGKSAFAKNKPQIGIIHVEICENRAEARKLEKFFKSGFGHEIIHELAEVVER